MQKFAKISLALAILSSTLVCPALAMPTPGFLTTTIDNGIKEVDTKVLVVPRQYVSSDGVLSSSEDHRRETRAFPQPMDSNTDGSSGIESRQILHSSAADGSDLLSQHEADMLQGVDEATEN